jgi:hypothetical protein
MRDYFKVTIKNSNIDVVSLAQWVKKVSDDKISAISAISIARDLLKGGTWSPNELSGDYLNNSHCNIAEEELPASQYVYYDDYSNLLRKGAAGDVESAIKYCNLALEGKVNHQAYACG